MLSLEQIFYRNYCAIMSVVCNLSGKLLSTKATSNPQYFLTKWLFPQEAYGKVFKIEEMPNPQPTTILCNQTNGDLLKLQPGQQCHLTASVSIKKANDGYPAQVQFQIIDCKPV